jgi:hypothetical protein
MIPYVMHPIIGLLVQPEFVSIIYSAIMLFMKREQEHNMHCKLSQSNPSIFKYKTLKYSSPKILYHDGEFLI